jgi:hypothetical protein
MNPVKKSITVRFFELKAESDIIKKFVGSFKSLVRLSKGTDVVTTAQGRYIIHCINSKDVSIDGREMLFWSSVKERNTWQVRSTQDGRIFSLEDANSIVGDISFYKFDPAQKVIAAFTTYSSAEYLKSMCTSIFKRLTSEASNFSIEYLSDDAGIAQVREWDYYSKISIKLDTDKISQSDDLPELIKALLGIKDVFGSNEISVTIDGGSDKLPKQDVTETINYLSSSESCSSLLLAGGMKAGEEKCLPINLKKAFIKYRTSVEMKINQKYIDFNKADSILSDAFSNTNIDLSL